MMSLETIRNQSRLATQRAAQAHRRPLLVDTDDLLSRDILKDHLRRMPNLGEHTPAGYQEIDVRSVVPGYPYRQFFVDSTGLDDLSGAALTHDAFFDHVQLLGPGYAYAIGEQGEFQHDVRLFKKG